MQKILILLADMLEKGLIAAVCKICDAVMCVFRYLQSKDDKKREDEKQKDIAKVEDEIKDACDNGTLDDLMDATEKMKKTKKKIAVTAAVLTLILSGCTTTTIDVHPTKNWEGRYDDKAKLMDAANSVQLENGESVWMLSNRTLKRLLTNTQEK